MLYKLLSYPKKTFTRAQLMDEFWGYETESDSRTVDVYITKLRSKVQGCDAFEIATVHGLGYKGAGTRSKRMKDKRMGQGKEQPAEGRKGAAFFPAPVSDIFFPWPCLSVLRIWRCTPAR